MSFGDGASDNSINGSDLKGVFPPGFIPFNDHLNCIIGGKSTGKSLLLHNIAYAIDPMQVRKKCGDPKPGAKNSIIDGVAVRWKDGTISRSSDDQHDHKIVYIPQTYLNRLSESEDESTDIDSIIESIVLGKKENKDAFGKMKSDLDALKKKTDSDIYQLRTLQGEAEDLINQQKEIGTREGIKKEIDDKERRRKEISAALSISEDDIKKYSEAEHEATELEGLIRKLSREKNSIEEIDTVVQALDFSSLELSESIQQLLNTACASAVQAADKSWQESKSGLLGEILGQIANAQKKLQEDKTVIESLAEQVRSIYKELTPFILSRKVDRQIIVVTHNANVVLGSDAEEVIVANQDGKNTPNDTYKFEYATGAIEHCDRTCEGEGVLYQFSIQQHICDILEGGREAFKHREQKYRINAE